MHVPGGEAARTPPREVSSTKNLGRARHGSQNVRRCGTTVRTRSCVAPIPNPCRCREASIGASLAAAARWSVEVSPSARVGGEPTRRWQIACAMTVALLVAVSLGYAWPLRREVSRLRDAERALDEREREALATLEETRDKLTRAQSRLARLDDDARDKDETATDVRHRLDKLERVLSTQFGRLARADMLLVSSAGDRLSGLIVKVAGGAASLKGQITTAEGATLPGRSYVYMVPAEREKSQDVLRFLSAPVSPDKTIMLHNIPPGRYFIVVQPALDDVRPTLTKLRLPNETETRARLRREGEAAKTEIEFKPCQNITDYQLPFSRVDIGNGLPNNTRARSQN